MQIEVLIVMFLLLVILIAGLYLVSVRRRIRRSQDKIEQPRQNPSGMKSANTPSQSSTVNSFQNENIGTSFEVEPKGTIDALSISPVQKQVQQVSEEGQPLPQQLPEVEPFGSQFAIEIKSPEDTLVEEEEPTPAFRLVKEELSPAANNGTSDTNIGSEEQTQAGAVKNLDGIDGKQLQQNRHISPEKRGGRSRMGGQEQHKGRTYERRKRSPKPEVICWKRNREWILGIEIPEELRDAAEMSILQNNVRLSEDDLRKGCWRLISLMGQIDIHMSDGEKIEIDFNKSNYLIFKLSGSNLDQGRYVKRPCAGSYLVIVSENWERDEELAGIAPATPEAVCLDGYCAHFFDLVDGSNSKIAFKNRADEIVSDGPRFELVGHELHDAAEHRGPLFRNSPPTVRVANGNWADVGTIVIGEEGINRGRWRESFNPNPGMKEQLLPDRITSVKAGWYFVRFYNLQDELIDSLDFRFVAGLRKITIYGDSLFPSAMGYREAIVEFQHDETYCVESAHRDLEGIKVEHTEQRTKLTIPPSPNYDRTIWLVGPCSGSRVEVEILLHRVWWAIGRVDKPPSQWQALCLSVSWDDFKATSDKAIWLRFPQCRYIDSVRVGFHQARSRPFFVKVAETKLAIPLCEFSDSQELADRKEGCSLKVWVVKVNGSYHEAVVITVAAEVVERPLDISRISACHLVHDIAILHRVTSGPLRQMFKEVRRYYCRPRRASVSRNTQFVQESLCVIAVFVQLAEAQQSVISKQAIRWRSKAKLAGREYPETMRKVWNRYRELEKQCRLDRRRGL
jgi:hypothetical protein